MKSTMNVLLRAAIAAAVTDREQFIDRVSSLIEDKAGTSPETAERMAGGVESLVDMLDQQLFIQQLTNSSDVDTTELEKKIDNLTASIDKLNVNLEKIANK